MICLDDDHDMFGWMMMMMMMMMTTTVIKQEYLTLNTMMIILSLSTAAQATYSTFLYVLCICCLRTGTFFSEIFLILTKKKSKPIVDC